MKGREGDVGRVWELSKRLWIHRLDSADAFALPGTEGALNPFWAPDSQNVAFFTLSGPLKRINVSGGPVETLGQATAGAGGSWSSGGVILCGGKGYFEPLYQISVSGGTPVPVTKIDQPGKDQHIWPQFLPDGRTFFMSFGAMTRRSLVCMSGLWIQVQLNDD